MGEGPRRSPWRLGWTCGGCEASSAWSMELRRSLIVAQGARGQVAYELLHAFTKEGFEPVSPLIQASDGDFYGTTSHGGAAGAAPSSRSRPTGTLTNASFLPLHAARAGAPAPGSSRAATAHLYGTTHQGGVSGAAPSSRSRPPAPSPRLHSFDCRPRAAAPSPGSSRPAMAHFYGTTAGTAARVRRHRLQDHGHRHLTTLHSFDCDTEGCSPVAGLIQASDGTFYGTTQSAAARSAPAPSSRSRPPALSPPCIPSTATPMAAPPPAASFRPAMATSTARPVERRGVGGTVFKITAAGTLTTLHSFDCNTEGSIPSPASSRPAMATSTASARPTSRARPHRVQSGR